MSPRTIAAALAVALAGCGGGVWFGFGDGFDDPPDVSLAASPGAARAGETVRLVAAASDDFGVRRVEFFVLDADGRGTLLGEDRFAPYELDVVMPGSASASVSFLARAVDDAGQASDSALVGVTVLR
jgi:hypothetical protein